MKRFLNILVVILFVPMILLAGDGEIMSFIKDSWKLIFGVLAFIAGGFYVPGVRRILFIALKAAISKKVLKELFFEAADRYAKSTKNTKVDDVWVAKMREGLKDE